MTNLIKQRPTVMQMISDQKSSTELIRAFANITVGDVVGAGYPPISGLKKEYGVEKIESVIAILIVEGTALFDKSINKAQALELAAEIASTYYYLTLEDLYIVLKEFRKSKQFGAISAAKILSATAEYDRERINIAEKRAIDAHLNTKDTFSERSYHETLTNLKKAQINAVNKK